MRSLKGMIVVITGASAGIGLALARRLHAGGATLVLSARRVDRLEALNMELDSKHVVVGADVSRRSDCEELIDRAYHRLGRIDTLVCNAGYGFYKSMRQTSPEDLREIFATNVFGTTDCISAAVPKMVEQSARSGWRGQVMIVSSGAARRGLPYFGAYCATKAAQLSIAEAMRIELAPQGIAVTSVHPIMTETDFGRVAEKRSGIVLPKGNRKRLTQPVRTVINAMVAAMVEPKPEVWTSLPTRVSLAANALFPSVGDSVMRKYKRKVDAANRSHD